jgi:mannosyltransferase
MRFHALDQQSLWDDEMSTLRTITTPMPAIVQRFATYEAHPPLYFLQLKIWRALQMRSLVKLRANSALWGTVCLLLVFLVARLYGGDVVGLLALAYLVLSPLHLAYSQEMRPYAMAMTLGLGSLLALEGRRWLHLGCLWTALLYTHYWGAFVVLAQALYGYTSVSSLPQKKVVLIAAGSAAVLFLPWLPILYAQLGVIDHLAFWVPPFSLMGLANVFAAYCGLFFNMASWTFYLRPRSAWGSRAARKALSSGFWWALAFRGCSVFGKTGSLSGTAIRCSSCLPSRF